MLPAMTERSRGVPLMLATLLTLLALLGSVVVSAYVFLFSNAARWPSGSVVMDLELGSSGPLTDGCLDWGECAEHALSGWNAAVSDPQFRVVRNSTSPRLDHDGRNVVFFSDDVYGTAFGDRTLAITLVWSRGTTLTDADVVFNRAKTFNSYRGPQQGTVYDFTRVAAHEFGHVLGLDHPDDAGQRVTALMNSTASSVETLQSDDVNGVRALYGLSPGPGATPTPLVVNFPPRNESLDFRNQLEAEYRTVLNRTQSSLSAVDLEGSVVWTQEYLRYRVNQCSSSDATTRVFMQIDGLGIQPVCGTARQAVFPPRNESFDFRGQLEAKYRDGLRRGNAAYYVDSEGDVVWTQEYLRLRVSGCSHGNAIQSVFAQITNGVPACR